MSSCSDPEQRTITLGVAESSVPGQIQPAIARIHVTRHAGAYHEGIKSIAP